MRASGFVTGLLAGAALTGLLWVGAQGASTTRVAHPIDGQLPTHCPDARTRAANEQAAEAFFIPSSTPDQLYNLMDPDYRQHNPIFKRFGQVNHLHGREEFRALMSARQRYGPTFGRSSAPPVGGHPLYRVMSDCDMVVVLEQRLYPDPQYPGRTYEAFWFDAWRVRAGKLVEHWDAATLPDPVPAFLTRPLNELPPAH